MKLCSLTKWDKKLTQFNFLNRERMSVRVYTHQGEVFCSKTISGASGHVSTFNEITCLLSQLISKARRKKLLVKSIEVAHTHRSHRIKLNEFRVGELSPRDMECASYLKNKFSYPLTMKVVTSFGFVMVSEE